MDHQEENDNKRCADDPDKDPKVKEPKKEQPTKPKPKKVKEEQPMTEEKLSRQDVEQIARQVAQQVAQSAAEQAASQVGQQMQQTVGQTVSDAISKLLQSQTMTTGMTTTQERMGDIGGTERLEKESMDNAALLFGNVKRTYDEYQQESLESIKRNRSYVDKVLSDAHSYDNQKQNIANQALQNAVETANMVGKQAVRHSDLAIDRQWNTDEQGYQTLEILKSLGSDNTTLKSVIAQVLSDMTKEGK
jgi:hypothetical protein